MRVCAVLCVVLLSAAPAVAAPAAKPTSFATRIAGLAKHDGFLPFYWDAKDGKLLLEVARLDRDFLYSCGLAGGAGTIEASLDRGQLGEMKLVRFARIGPRVLLVQRQLTQRSGVADAERSRVVTESFPDAVLAALPLVAEDGDRLLLDATDFLLNDASVLPGLNQAGQGTWRQDAARSALRLERSGAFPKNTEIEALMTFTSDQPGPGFGAVLPDGHTMTLVAHHTFLELPPPGYRTRALDPRIGFFTQSYQDHTAPISEPIARDLVCRWRLARRDSNAVVSEPVQPIVYYLDRGIPEPEREAIRKATLWWNHAFEEAGYRNALVLQDLPEGATFLDARYSGIEWINRGERAWSIGQSQVDPRTGEILHAVALIDSHRRRTTSRIWRNLTPPVRGCSAGDSPDASWAADDVAGVDEETLVLQRLAYLAAHEVGHTLGLQHDHAATTFGWGSVMDYLAPHIELDAAGGLDLSDAYPHDIGAYDRLMIRWGYAPTEDAATLDRIVREGYARGMVFPLESDARWCEYDWGPEPQRWLATTLRVRRVLLDRFGVGQLKPGTPVYALQERFSLAYLYHRFAIGAAQKAVGGAYATNALAGDGQAPTAWVPAERQREALTLLMSALEPAQLDVPDRIVAALVDAPQSTNRTRERFRSEAGELFSPLTAARTLAGLIVDPLLEPERAARLTLPRPDGTPDLDAVVRLLIETTWGAAPPRTERLAMLLRVSQRVVLDDLMALAQQPAATPEVRAVALAQLTSLRTSLHGRAGRDAATTAHVRLAERDVAEFLDHPETHRVPRAVPSPPPGRPIGSGEMQ